MRSKESPRILRVDNANEYIHATYNKKQGTQKQTKTNNNDNTQGKNMKITNRWVNKAQPEHTRREGVGHRRSNGLRGRQAMVM